MEKPPKLQVMLITGRTIEQGVGKEHSKNSAEYAESTSICFIDPEDLKELGIKDETNVLVSTSNGEVVLRAKKSTRVSHPGIIYVPYGPWANAVVDSETSSVGMPSLKGISAEVEPAQDKPLLGVAELLRAQFGKE